MTTPKVTEQQPAPLTPPKPVTDDAIGYTTSSPGEAPW